MCEVTMREMDTFPDLESSEANRRTAASPKSASEDISAREKRKRQDPGLYFARSGATREEIAIEFTRKSIHLLIAFVPLLLSISRPATIALLAAGIVAYAVCESLRMRGVNVPVISYLTAKAARQRDGGRFVVGPITLGLGALLAIVLFEPIPAMIATYVLAFGDGFSSLVGKTLGRIQIPLTKGKSLEGSLTCFSVSFLSALAVSGKIDASLAIAAVSTIVEALPLKDLDNMLLPLCAGTVAVLLGL
jgi:phytol kinase